MEMNTRSIILSAIIDTPQCPDGSGRLACPACLASSIVERLDAAAADTFARAVDARHMD